MTAKAEPADPVERLASAPPEEQAVWEALRTVEDPELPVSVVDLGLIYRVEVADGHVDIDLTLTYSGCPARDLIVSDVERAALDTADVESVDVSLVYSPQWSLGRITDRGRESLTEFGLAVPEEDEAPDSESEETFDSDEDEALDPECHE